MKNLRLLGLLVIAAHGVVDIWHLLLTPKIIPLMTLPQVWPVIGMLAAIHFAVAVWLLPRRFAGVLLFVLLLAAFLIGGYEHFLSPGLNSVLHAPLRTVPPPSTSARFFSPFSNSSAASWPSVSPAPHRWCNFLCFLYLLYLCLLGFILPMSSHLDLFQSQTFSSPPASSNLQSPLCYPHSPLQMPAIHLAQSKYLPYSSPA